MHLVYVKTYLHLPVFMVPMALTEREEASIRASASDFPLPKPPQKHTVEASGHPTGRAAYCSGWYCKSSQ